LMTGSRNMAFRFLDTKFIDIQILLCFLLKFAKLTGYLDISTEFCLEIHVRLAGLFMQATTMGCASPM